MNTVAWLFAHLGRLVVILLAAPAAAHAQAVTSIDLEDARVAVTLDGSLLGSLGCIDVSRADGRPPLWRLSPLSVEMKHAVVSKVSGELRLQTTNFAPDLQLTGRDAGLQQPVTLHCAEGSVEVTATGLEPVGSSLELSDSVNRLLFVADNPQMSRNEADRLYQLFNFDLRVGRDLAALLGSPRLAGAAIGTVAFAARTLHWPISTAPNDSCVSAGWEGVIDVELTDISAVDASDQSGGTVAITPTAHLRNVGTADVPWFRKFVPIQDPPSPLPAPFAELDQHPYLVWSLYRLDGTGRIRQLGQSPLKHAFNATNTQCGCTTFTHDRFFPGCHDLYSASTNRSDQHLGPLDEVRAHLGLWRSCASHFDEDGDCQPDADHHAESEPPHRLTVPEASLQTAESRYFLSSWYIVREDVDIFNSMGIVEIEPTPGSLWTFPVLPRSFRAGSALDLWTEVASSPGKSSGRTLVNRTLDTGEGRLQLALRRTPIADGFRFDLALANHDYDRGVREIAITIPKHHTAKHLEFTDIDHEPSNDWTPSRDGRLLRWRAPAGNELDWARTYSFAFVTDEPIFPTRVDVEPHEAGDLDDPSFTWLRSIFDDDFEDGTRDAWDESVSEP